MLFETGDVKRQDEILGTIDVWQLRHYRWPFLRLLTRSSVEELELHHYLKSQLASGAWTTVRAVSHVEADGHASTHRFDIFGRSARTA